MIRDFANNNYKSKRKIKKDYKRKDFINPYFENKSTKNKEGDFNTKLYLKIIAGVFFVYIIIFSNLFKIENIEINGIDMINGSEFRNEVNEQLDSWKWFLLPQKNLLFLSKNKLSNQLLKKYKLERLEINKGWKKITITIEEKINYLIIYNNDKFFFADGGGNITREITQEEAINFWEKFPILNIYRDINVGDNITNENIVKFILEFNEKIKQTDIEFHGFETNGESEVTLVSKIGWRSHFNINSNIAESIENMQLILKEKIEDQSKLEYIDLRFGNKVFYK